MAQYKFEVGQTYENVFTITARTKTSVTINDKEFPVKVRNVASGDEIEFVEFINDSLSAKNLTSRASARFEEGKTYIGKSRRDNREYVCTRRSAMYVTLQSKEGSIHSYITRDMYGDVVTDFQYSIRAINQK